MASIFDSAKKMINKVSDNLNKDKWDKNCINSALFTDPDPGKLVPPDRTQAAVAPMPAVAMAGAGAMPAAAVSMAAAVPAAALAGASVVAPAPQISDIPEKPEVKQMNYHGGRMKF